MAGLLLSDDIVDVMIDLQCFRGYSKEDALAMAEAQTGQHAVADLWRKARRLAALYDQYHAAVGPQTKRTLRRQIKAAIEEEYAHELCAECMVWLRERVGDVIPSRKRTGFNANLEISCWYEVATKQIRKSGCEKCPWHVREEAEWAKTHPVVHE